MVDPRLIVPPRFPTPLQIVKGTRQVVSGMKYELTLRVVRTDCDNSAHETRDVHACAAELGSDRYLDLSIWSQPWRDPRYQVEIKGQLREQL